MKREEEENTAKENLQELGMGELIKRMVWICVAMRMSIDEAWQGIEPPYGSRESHVKFLQGRGESEMAPYIEELNRRFPVTS